jgi:hypothetical protein
MEAQVGGTEVGQKWRVTGIKEGERPDGLGESPALVCLEFWTEYEGREYGHDLKTFDPELARLLGHHLVLMANYADGLL